MINVNNLQKCRSQRNKISAGILITLVLSKPGIQYLWLGKSSACKVLVPIKVEPVNNYCFLRQKLEKHRYQMNRVFIGK